MARPTPWDVLLALRTVALATIALAAVAVVEAITDERGAVAAGTGGRAIGVLPLAPVAAAVAVVIAIAPTSSAGELRALAALGCGPWRARFAPIACAIAIAIGAAIGIAAGRANVEALFPPAVPAGDLRVVQGPDGASFVSEHRRIRITPGDVLERTGPPPPGEESTRPDRRKTAGAALAVALAGIALATWAGAPLRRGVVRSVVTLTVWGASEVLAFQAAGGGALSPIATAAPSLALLAVVLLEDVRERRLRREEAWM